MTQSEKNNTIIIVDDEDMVLKSLKNLLELETNYKVQTFTSARSALEYLKDNNTDVVVSDYLMPEMNGMTFLAHVRDLNPEITRIILTGYADKENAIKAINEVGLFQYIEKPWDNDDFMIILRNGVEKKSLMNKLREKIQEINNAYGELQDMQDEILKAFI